MCRDRDRDRDRDGRKHKDTRTEHTHHKHKSSRHHHHHHHHSSRHHRDRDHDTSHTRTAKRDHSTKRRSGNNNNAESGRHPSSSVGPGRIEAVLLIILILLAISSAALISVSIWLYAVRNGWASGLNQTGSITWTRFISYATAALLVGLLLVPIILIAIAASLTPSGSGARKLRLALIFLTTIAIVILLMMTITGLLFATSGPPFISNALEQSWRNTVSSPSFGVACHVQRVNGCFGWADNSCVGCRPLISGDYTGCSAEQRLVCPTCFQRTRSPVNASRLMHPTSPASASGPVHPRQYSALHTVIHRGRAAIHSGVERLRVALRGSAGLVVRQSQDYEFGCFRYIIWRNREFYIPMSVYTIFLILVLTLLQWKACIDSSGRR